MYIRDKREIDGGGDEKSAPPRERKTTNKKKTKKNEREREKERERRRHVVIVSRRGFKIILPFFCCFFCACVFMGEEFSFLFTSLSINTRVQLLRVLVLLYYYLGTTNTILQIYS